MKISTKGRYALRMMIDLAINNNGGYISLKDISSRQEISDKYSEQIINQLSKAGLVKSIRGSKGGYMLSKRPEEYTVGDVLRVMEGSLAPVACVEEGNEYCKRASTCVTIELWQKLNNAINDVVDNITLEDLVNRQKELQNI
jgi:Rrf2 family protein